MPILSPKCRLVSFRLTEEEYEELRAICQAYKARTLSDFVRDSMCWMMKQRVDAASDGQWSATLDKPIRPALQINDHLSKGEVAKEIEALTNMLLNLHRRTEVLGQQVDRLFLLMRAGEDADPLDGGYKEIDVHGVEGREISLLRHAE